MRFVAPPQHAGLREFARSLSGRLLGLTVLFVLVAEVLILAPSLANYRTAWLAERASRAAGVAEALAAVSFDPTGPAADQVLDAVGARSVRLGAERSGMTLGVPTADARVIALDTLTLGGSLRGVADTLLARPGGVLRIVAGAPPRTLEVEVDEAALASDLRAFAARVLVSSIFISLITASLVYATLSGALVRPMRELTRHIERFRERPQDASIALRPSGRQDEIGRAEVALAEMEQELRQALRQRERLAGLGAAVARIAHDMRASLATAQLVSERLASVEDPTVRQVAPRLARAIERAGGLAEAALVYGKAEEPKANIAALDIAEALDEAAAEALAGLTGVQWRNGARAGLPVLADADQLHRVLSNLIRNSGQALARQQRSEPGTVAATATRVGDRVLVRIVDDGPGLPPAVQERLFEPFTAGGAAHGVGLGLAIANELTTAQGGALRLLSSSAQGVTFEIDLAAG